MVIIISGIANIAIAIFNPFNCTDTLFFLLYFIITPNPNLY